MQDGSDQVVVIGAGIVGVSAAIWLRRAGAQVSVVDRVPPGTRASTSFGNAGILAACAVTPVTGPGMLRKIPKMLADSNFPLFMRWVHLPRMLPWLLEYLSHANAPETRRISQGLAPLLYDTVEQHMALAGGTEAAQWIAKSEYSFAYRSRAEFDADAFVWGLREEAGFAPELLEGGAAREFEPNLSPDLGLLAVMRDHGHIRDPGGYVAALGREAERLGARFVQAEARDVELRDGRVRGVVTDAGEIPCATAILATGVWSGPLARKLGLKVPLESERGYHIVFREPRGGPRTPIMVASGKFVATPMAAGLRCAGVIEFGGTAAPASAAPLDLLRRQLRESFPGFECADEEPWLGHRPAPADSLPLIGEIGATGVLAGFGHHHIGLTSGPKTGRMLAGLATGRRENIDNAAWDPMRFRAGQPAQMRASTHDGRTT